nr:MAG TPA: hypothetical protein [Myoviridae sp. ctRUJ25]
MILFGTNHIFRFTNQTRYKTLRWFYFHFRFL